METGICVVKFSKFDHTVGTPLIEGATMRLATQAGIHMATTQVLPLLPRHGNARDALNIEHLGKIGSVNPPTNGALVSALGIHTVCNRCC